MSALPPKADIGTQSWNVRFVPKADIVRCGEIRRYSITSSARARKVVGRVTCRDVRFVPIADIADRNYHWLYSA